MVNPELITYIKGVLEQGHSHETVREHLIKHGYTHEHINEAFNHPHIRTHITKKAFKPNKSRKKKKTSMLFFIIPIIIILLITGYLLLQKLDFNLGPSACEDVSISVHVIKDEEVLCVSLENSIIQTILKNNGGKVINDVYIEIKGNEGNIKQTLENLNLAQNDVSTHVVDYSNENGNVKEVIIIPIISKDGKDYTCKSKKVRYNDIKAC